MAVNDEGKPRNKITYKITLPKKFIDPKKMLTEKDIADGITDTVVTAVDMKTGAILGKYSLIEYRLKFL